MVADNLLVTVKPAKLKNAMLIISRNSAIAMMGFSLICSNAKGISSSRPSGFFENVGETWMWYIGMDSTERMTMPKRPEHIVKKKRLLQIFFF